MEKFRNFAALLRTSDFKEEIKSSPLEELTGFPRVMGN